jgi:hypothetical protein
VTTYPDAALMTMKFPLRPYTWREKLTTAGIFLAVLPKLTPASPGQPGWNPRTWPAEPAAKALTGLVGLLFDPFTSFP